MFGILFVNTSCALFKFLSCRDFCHLHFGTVKSPQKGFEAWYDQPKMAYAGGRKDTE
jgi:hypothetical protein